MTSTEHSVIRNVKAARIKVGDRIYGEGTGDERTVVDAAYYRRHHLVIITTVSPTDNAAFSRDSYPANATVATVEDGQ